MLWYLHLSFPYSAIGGSAMPNMRASLRCWKGLVNWTCMSDFRCTIDSISQSEGDELFIIFLDTSFIAFSEASVNEFCLLFSTLHVIKSQHEGWSSALPITRSMEGMTRPRSKVSLLLGTMNHTILFPHRLKGFSSSSSSSYCTEDIDYGTGLVAIYRD